MKKIFKRIILKLANFIYKIIDNYAPWILDPIINRKTIISVPNSKIKISYCNFGPTTRWRAKLSITKEKNTIKWINSFEDGAKFLDVGAHMGIFTLYAAKVKDCSVVSIEPSSITSCILNLNIHDNQLNDKVVVHTSAAGNRKSINKYHMGYMTIDAASGNPFNPVDPRGINYVPIFSQGVVEITLDDLYKTYDYFDYVKIDIDGNEDRCLNGAKEMFNDKRLKSILIELNGKSDNYDSIVEMIESFGFELDNGLTSESYISRKLGSKIYNHIFIRNT